MTSRPAARRLFASALHNLAVGGGLAAGAAGGYLLTATFSTADANDRPALTAKRRDALVEIVAKVKAAVVNIHSERTVANSTDDPFRPSGVVRPQHVRGMGTGIVLDPRGYVVTNYHVIDDVQMLRVALHDGTSLPARVLATDKKSDLAVIKIDPPCLLPTVPLGTAADLLEAEQVIAIGNAFGYEHTVSIGNVAYKSRDVTLNKEISYQNLIQTTAPINPGNSGGPLFNKKGELVGVNVAIRAGAQNIAFAIPVDAMIDRAADMLSTRKRTGLRHGLALKDRYSRADEEATVRRWVEVALVEPDSPAAAAGLKSGDVLERVGDVTVVTSIDVERAFLERSVSSALDVSVKRAGEPVTVSLGLQPAGANAAADAIWKRVGVRAVPAGKEVVAKVDPQLRGGLSLVDVGAGTPAARAGLQRGDVLIGFQMHEPLESISLDNVQFVLNHKELAKYSPLKMFFVRDGKLRETFLTPE